MPRYSAVCCYFGHWPSTFACWLRSCSYNKEIDFWLVTDIPTDGYVIPANVRLLRVTFEELRKRIIQKFPDIKVSLDRPYKLCDFKTAYGYIFEEELRDYDYWGMYDIDTIWGNICQFIPDNEDNHLEKIFPCGHLSFVRNTPELRESFRLVNQLSETVPWEKVFATSQNYFYDEFGGFEPLFLTRANNNTGCYYGGVDFDDIFPAWKFDHFRSINFPEKSRFLLYSVNKGRVFRHYLKFLKRGGGKDRRGELFAFFSS